MQTPPLHFQRFSTANSSEETIRAIVFSLPRQQSIGDLEEEEELFALPVEAVTKIILCPPLTDRFATNMRQGIGAIELDGQMLTIVDLAYQFNSEVSSEFYKFLILFQLNNGDFCGIPTARSPFASDIPLSSIRNIPLSFRQVNHLDFVDRLAVVPRPDRNSNWQIYLIGVDEILERKMN